MDWQAAQTSAVLALLTSLLLAPIGIALAYWLSFTRSRMKPFIEAITLLPLLLPPTVLGLYLLIALGPESPLYGGTERVFGGPLVFQFEGLVLASLIANLPFMVQPIQRSLSSIPASLREAAWTSGLSKWRTFWRVDLPLSWPGLITGIALTTAHTLGEFGVVLMIGGNLPGETRTLSIAIYDSVQALDMDAAHTMSLSLLGASIAVLVLVFRLNRKREWLARSRL